MRMKQLLALVLGILLLSIPVHAVLKERDLARTIGVLRAELTSDYERQQVFIQMYEQQGATQHQQLVSYMNQCEQIGLMLYSQSYENTFDMAYACQQAVNLYRSLDVRRGSALPYDKIIMRMKRELDRYDALITSLKSMPPVGDADADEVLTENDSILLNAIDSLENHLDSLAATASGPAGGVTARHSGRLLGFEHVDAPTEPLYLTGQELEDRAACLEYAQTMRDNLQHFLESLEAESSYYESVRKKVQELNSFAQERYKLMQTEIFREGSSNYVSILLQLPRYIRQASRATSTKYRPFRGHRHDYSEWRGVPVLFISLFILIYLSLAIAIAYVVVRWLVPKRWRGPHYAEHRHMLTCVVGIALFAVMVMVVRSFVHRNFIQMGTSLIIDIAWLLEAIFLSLYIRLRGVQMRRTAMTYTPLMVLAFVVILFRIILIPNVLLNLIFPPLLLLFTFWQMSVIRRFRSSIPLYDMIYAYITLIVFVLSCLAAWIGYTLLTVQVLVWWIIQLAAITTITCFYDLMRMYEQRHLLTRIRPDLKDDILEGRDVSVSAASVLRDINNGRYITQTWFYDFVNRTLVPLLAVVSVPASIYWAAGIFEMTSICQKAFFAHIIDQQDLIRLSLYKLCIVAELFFIFRYVNYFISSLYASYRLRTASANETVNLTLARNVNAILIWGLYVIITLVILNVPKSGISIVTAGLATGLGFAMQHLIENFFYGISLMTGRLRVGDYIECDGISGKVESITYQSTQIITADGCVIAFLNSTLFSKNFKNLTRNHNYELVKIPVGVAYGTNVEEVRRLLIDALNVACQGKNMNDLPYINPNQPISVAFSDFGESSVDLKVCVWMLVEEKIRLTGLCKETIYNTLNQHHIEIPFPQREVKVFHAGS